MYYEFSHNLQEITHTINVKNNNDFPVDVCISYFPEYISKGSCRKYDYVGQEKKTIEPHQNATFHLNIKRYAGSCDAEQRDSMKGTYKGEVALIVGNCVENPHFNSNAVWKYTVPYTVVLK